MPRANAPFTSASVRSPRTHEHEVRGALPVREAEAIARRVEQRLRLRDLPQVAVQVIEIAERRLHRDDGGDVDAVDRNREADRLERRRRADQAPMRMPARPNAFENVRPTMTFGKRGELGDEGVAGELRVRLVDEDDRARGHASRRSSGSRRAASATPVGLFGFVRKTTRVFGVIAASTSSSGKREVGPRHHLDERARRRPPCRSGRSRTPAPGRSPRAPARRPTAAGTRPRAP